MNEVCKSLIFTALGTASMCWNPRPGNQVFVSEEALEVGNQLIAALDKELATVDIQKGTLKMPPSCKECFVADKNKCQYGSRRCHAKLWRHFLCA